MQNVQSVKRVKTTQELVQELAMMRSTSPGMPPSQNPARNDDVTSQKSSGGGLVNEETREELMNRFFDSQNGGSRKNGVGVSGGDVLSPPTSLGVPSPPSEPTTALAAAAAASKSDHQGIFLSEVVFKSTFQ